MMLSPASRSLRFSKNVYVYACRPPTSRELIRSTDEHGIQSKIYRNPWYSKESDAPERPREYAGLVFHLKGGEGIGNLEDWKSDETAPSTSGEPARPLDATDVGGWEYASTPPTVRQVRIWLKEQKGRLDARTVRIKDSSQVLSVPFLSKRSLVKIYSPDWGSDTTEPVWVAKHARSSFRQGATGGAEHDGSGTRSIL